MIEKIEQVTDWVWEHKARFCAALGALGVLGFGIGTAQASKAVTRAAEMADNNLLDIE